MPRYNFPRITPSLLVCVILANSGPTAKSASIDGPNLCGSCGLQKSGVYEFRFAELDLGLSVDSWSSVDINQDGLWELAILEAGPGERVGVYSPNSAIWLDGPRSIPVDRDSWGIADLDEDGVPEYIYISGADVRSFNPTNLLDSLLWTAPFEPAGFVVWGMDDSGVPLCAVLRTGDRDQYSGVTYWHWDWEVRRVSDGRVFKTVSGGLGSTRIISGYPEVGNQCLALLITSGWTLHHCGGPCGSYEQVLRIVDASWDTRAVCSLPTQSGMSHFVMDLWGLDHLAFWNGEGESWFITHTRPMLGWGISLDQFVSGRGVPTGEWDYIIPPVDLYRTRIAGLAFQNLDGQGVRLLTSLSTGEGWEIRESFTGVLLDTLGGLPAADLRNGPLLRLDDPNLFYLADSTLYIYQPGVATGILDDIGIESQQSLSLTLSASPNPFNSSVTLTWNSDDALEVSIHNVLGQSIKSFDLGEFNSHKLVWDGTDSHGRGVASGIYFARLQTLTESITYQLVVLK